MTVPVPLLIVALLTGVLLIAVAVVSVGAWFGIWLQREEERRRLLRGEWTCDRCGTVMRFTGETVDGRHAEGWHQ